MLYCKWQGLLLSLNSQTFVISNFNYKVDKCLNNNDEDDDEDDDEDEATEKIIVNYHNENSCDRLTNYNKLTPCNALGKC